MTSGTALLPRSEWVHPREREHVATYRAYLFGPFRVFKGEEVLGQRRQRREKALLLLKWFLLNPGKPASMDQLIDLGWQDTAPEKAASGFHVGMHCLRRMLEPDLRPGQESSFIHRSGTNFYRFEANEGWWSDANEVERLFEQARASDAHCDARRACFYYSRVAAYTVRRFLEDEESQQQWLAPYRRQYEGLCSQALIRLIQIHRARGELDEALEYAYEKLRLDPYNELAATTIIEAHLQLGRPTHALRQLSVFLLSLERDLGAAAGSNLLALREKIMRMPPNGHGPGASAPCPIGG
ncbi:AfsR/SARP family transcriptional regulator [Streptomyces albipurpureus]|uniref:Bacterial transcriptional activator domain-containing protein n=1 Tax=Streptomyces albipurpureus TaxID=2897419 RepID=A0ABT0UP64_9ACTN|nr:bacterial transcriptional activator domain-containing protein [Streptomyces sp. CWNU-1]MCM2389885.1 bacterial transcriptional activator domain-containing protein [Streptomyces sp. CWNU-1]